MDEKCLPRQCLHFLRGKLEHQACNAQTIYEKAVGHIGTLIQSQGHVFQQPKEKRYSLSLF
jgi:hypothetical protein